MRRRLRPQHRTRHQAGLTLLESLLSVGVVAAGLTVIGSLQLSQIDFEKAAVTAQQHRIVHYAGRRYLRDHLGGLANKAKAAQGNIIEMDLQPMIQEGYLPNFMLNNGEIRPNPYGKSYKILIRAVDGPHDGDQLELLTLAIGGRDLSRTMTGRIVSVMGAEAGFVSSTGGSIDGAYGSWVIDLSEFPDAFRPPPNTLAALAFYRAQTGVYVNPFQVNIPAMEDRYQELPITNKPPIAGINTPSPAPSSPALPATPKPGLLNSSGFGIYGGTTPPLPLTPKAP